MRLVLLLKLALLHHDLALVAQQVLLFSALSYLLTKVTVSLLMYLLNDLAKLVLILILLENDSLIEAIAHKTIHETGHKGIGHIGDTACTSLWLTCL